MRLAQFLLIAAILIHLAGCSDTAPPDEAKAAGKTALDFQAVGYNFFDDMDMTADANGKLVKLDLTLDEIKGRNTWVMWCGGNEAFWDWLAGHSYGFLDLLKLVASPDRATALHKRKNRFADTGMVNEPAFKLPAEKDEYGLFLEVADDPNRSTPPAEVYGQSSGVVGLRLFKNPKFDDKAHRHWDAARYFTDAKYANNPDLVRPYRVGMSCGFCHVAPHPLNPPRDPAEPQWANLSSNIGNQYWRARAIFGGLLKPDNFIYHVLDSQPPGTIDTSLIASDNINNPNTINAVLEVPARLDRSGITSHRDAAWLAKNKDWWAKAKSWNLPEQQSAASLKMPVLLEYPPDQTNPRLVPRILLDGSDSVGAWGALARVYLNIGTYHQEWVRLHNTVVGGKKQMPFKIETCEQNSVYWQANKTRVEYLAKFFLKSTAPMRLKDAPEGRKYLKRVGVAMAGQPIIAGVPWHNDLQAGRKVFARRCIVCHSSKQPALFQEFAAEEMKAAPGVKRRWNDLLDLLDDPAYQAWSQKAVEDPEFWQDNFLSTDHRVPLTLLRTNSARSMATNAIEGHVWEDFSSETYRKSLAAVGDIEYFDPFAPGDPERNNKKYAAPGGGRGYYRPATLVTIWATAPFLHNNSVGVFTNDPSVAGRMKAFDDAIDKLLVRAGKTTDPKGNPLSRDELFALAAVNRWKKGSDLNGSTLGRTTADHGLIWRTPSETRLHIAAAYLPNVLSNATAFDFAWMNRAPWLVPAGLLLLALVLLLSADCTSNWRLLGYVSALALAFGVLFGAFIILKRVAAEFAAIDPVASTIGLVIVVVLAGLFLFFLGFPGFLRWLAYVFIVLAALLAFASYFFAGRLGDLDLGPIPAGTPVNLFANLGPDPVTGEFAPAAIDVIKQTAVDLAAFRRASTEQDRRAIQQRIAERLMTVNRCPDFVMDRGHYFAAALTEQELKDLIDLIKTF